MAKKGRKSEKSKRPPIRFLLLVLLGFSGIALFAVGVYLSLPPSKQSRPPYEESYLYSTGLERSIRQIDHAVFEALYQCGVEKNQISRMEIQPRHEGDKVWDFTVMSVKCPDQALVDRLQAKIAQEIEQLRPVVEIRKERNSRGEITCHVFFRGIRTHRLFLTLNSYGLPFRDYRPKVTIIIDDMGYDRPMAQAFLDAGLPVSYSVLPHAPYSAAVAKRARQMGYEVLLHAPMEPKNYPSVNPGPGALLLCMEDQELKQVLHKDLIEVPGVQGVNNHMGSSFTENEQKMSVFLNELKKRGLFYVDSRTTSRTVGLKLAREIHLPAAERSVFLDNDLSTEAIRMQLERLLIMAMHSGSAIGIGHPHPEMLKALKEFCPRMRKEYQVVPAGDLTG